VTVTVAFFQLAPTASTPCFFRSATAAFAYVSTYAPDGAFLMILNLCAIDAVHA